MADYIDWKGAGGPYRYWFLDNLTASGIKAEPGNYMFVKPTVNNGWIPVYIGQADNLSARISSHDRWEDAKKAGATRVMSHTTPSGEASRLAEEKDLISSWNPVCNTQHRTPTRKWI